MKQLIDELIVKIKARFNDSERILLAITACNPKVSKFLDLEVLTPLIIQHKLELCKLKNELPVQTVKVVKRFITRGRCVLCVKLKDE